MGAATERAPNSDLQADGPTARYVAIITDGNGRWARAHGVSVNEGHNAGADTVKARLRDAAELGVKELTVYSFSTENWSRPSEEVEGLMDMFSRRIADENPELHDEGVRMRFIGHRDRISQELVKRMAWAEALTEHNTRISLFVAFDYGGCLYAPEMHDPDLIIRTSGERRLSNYLLWQSAYSELVFREELWPDFSRQALEQSLAEFSRRRRRFGRR